MTYPFVRLSLPVGIARLLHFHARFKDENGGLVEEVLYSSHCQFIPPLHRIENSGPHHIPEQSDPASSQSPPAGPWKEQTP